MSSYRDFENAHEATRLVTVAAKLRKGSIRILRRRYSAAVINNNNVMDEIRSNKKWNHLRDDETLKKRIGEFIELPCVPGDFPKGVSEKDLSSFLLTQQRWKIVEEVTQAIGHGPLKTRTNNGLCLSGPHGVGKSAINYLLEVLHLQEAGSYSTSYDAFLHFIFY